MQKVSVQIIKNAKRNRYKRTNEPWYSRPLRPFLKGTETKYEMKTKRALLVKNKNIYKKEEDRDTQRDHRQKAFVIGITIVNRD